MFEQEKLKTVYMAKLPCDPEMLMKEMEDSYVQDVEERFVTEIP